MLIEITEDYKKYFSILKENFNRTYKIAKKARLQGKDPFSEPESKIAIDLAERTEKSVGPIGISERIRKLSMIMPREEIAFKIAEEIISGEYNREGIKAAEQAIRTALSILDEGVTAAPIQGIVKVIEKKNPDGTIYLAIYFAGPIRSAGGTEMALTLIVADFVRQLLGLDRYKASKSEAERFVEELRIYEKEVARFQYNFTDEELTEAILNLPVEVTGVETDPIEVVSYRNIERIETNRVRGGALRVVNDGLIGRANKVLKIVGKLGISGWDWLQKIKPKSSDEVEDRQYKFMEEVIAGRPVFSFPNKYGGFRLRYGRSRNTGLASVGIHPATMFILGRFIATGTQIKLEKPGKAGITTPVDSIEPPIVKLKNGTVLRVENVDTAKNISENLDSILFIGDILIGFGEFLENNQHLERCGYVEEWWVNHLENAIEEIYISTEVAARKIDIDPDRLRNLIENPFKIKPSVEEAFNISKKLKIPLHPKYTYFWNQINVPDLLYLKSLVEKIHSKQSKYIKLPLDGKLKNILENICLPHRIEDDNIIIEGDDAITLSKCFTPQIHLPSDIQNITSRELLNHISKICIMDKAGIFIGTRMGRPEKAKVRAMKPLVHSLFPVGLYGGSKRNIIEAANKTQFITIELNYRNCPSCNEKSFSFNCPKCKISTKPSLICPKCQRDLNQDTCPICKIHGVNYRKNTINIKELIDKAKKNLNLKDLPEIVKGVKGLSNEDRVSEPIDKGILRALNGLSTFKDGTIRFDATNAILTHFKPSEIGLTIDKARSFGYHYDINKISLESSDQFCMLMMQDVIIPNKCGEYLVKVAQFIDDLLKYFYGLPSFYHVTNKEDLLGQLIIGLSPHTSVGVIGRVIGFTDTNVCFAHPFWQAAKRRDCDGDEDGISLLLDVLLNFSLSYLPEKIGGMMDAPLLLTLELKPAEIARQAYNIEAASKFPLQFFKAAMSHEDPKKMMENIDMVCHRLNSSSQFAPIGFTHETNNINEGNHESIYTQLATMSEKVREQLKLAEIIKAVDARDVAFRVVSTHFMRDVTGNLRAFSTQKVRCKKCNTKYRRVPLLGKCLRCGGELSLTVFQGSIEKYLELIRKLVKKYEIGSYHEQRLMLVEHEINRLFNPKSKQSALGDYM